MWNVIDRPPLLEYAQANHQLTTVPQVLIGSISQTLSMTSRTILVRNYLLERIAYMDKDTSANLRKIRYDSIYKKAMADNLDSTGAKKLRASTGKILDTLTAENHIKGWAEYSNKSDKGVTGIIIYL